MSAPFAASERGRHDAPIDGSPIRDALRADPHAEAIVGASEVHFQQGASAAFKRLFVRCPLERLLPALDPRTWPRLSPMFRETRKIDEPIDPGEPGKVSWSGKLLEQFVVDFGPVRLNRFDVVLRIDLTLGADRARLDYGFLFDRTDQLLLDDGYTLAAKVPGHPGWTFVEAKKLVKFRSHLMNTFQPAAMAIMGEQDPRRLLGAGFDG